MVKSPNVRASSRRVRRCGEGERRRPAAVVAQPDAIGLAAPRPATFTVPSIASMLAHRRRDPAPTRWTVAVARIDQQVDGAVDRPRQALEVLEAERLGGRIDVPRAVAAVGFQDRAHRLHALDRLHRVDELADAPSGLERGTDAGGGDVGHGVRRSWRERPRGRKQMSVAMRPIGPSRRGWSWSRPPRGRGFLDVSIRGGQAGAVRRLARTCVGSLLVASLIAGAGVGCAPAPPPPPPPRPPDVFILLVDTLRADRVGAYGTSRRLTPFLDTLAARSAVFAHAYAQCSWTAPSVASLFTSRFQSQHGIITFASRLDVVEITLCEAPPRPRLRHRGLPRQPRACTRSSAGRRGSTSTRRSGPRRARTDGR